MWLSNLTVILCSVVDFSQCCLVSFLCSSLFCEHLEVNQQQRCKWIHFGLLNVAIETNLIWVWGQERLRVKSEGCHLIIMVNPTWYKHSIRSVSRQVISVKCVKASSNRQQHYKYYTRMHAHTDRQEHTHRHARTQTQTRTHRHTHTDTQRHTHTHTHTHTYSHTHTHTQTHTHTHTHTDTQRHTHTHTHTHTHRHTDTHTHTHTHVLTHTHTHTNTHTHTHTHRHAHTDTQRHTHVLTHTHTHTHTHSLSNTNKKTYYKLNNSLSLSLCANNVYII